MLAKVNGFGKRVDSICHNIGVLSKRHDERFDMIMSKLPVDADSSICREAAVPVQPDPKREAETNSESRCMGRCRQRRAESE